MKDASIALYAGTFGPITNGHLAVIEPCLDLFDELVIGIGQNPNKNCPFTEQERIDMINESIHSLGICGAWRIEVFPYMFLVDYANQINASFYVRGLRDEDDYQFERRYANMNSKFMPDIQPIWIPAPKEFSEVSSSAVLQICGIDKWESRVRDLVPEPVFKVLLKKYNGKWDFSKKRRGTGN